MPLPWSLPIGKKQLVYQSPIMLKNNAFCEYVKFGVISWKFDILLITALLKFESKIPFAHVWHVSFWLSAAHHISYLLNRFSLKYGFSFQILRVFTVNHLKDRFLKKIPLKRAKTQRLFFRKTWAQTILLL